MTINNTTLFEEKSFWLRGYGNYSPNQAFSEDAHADVTIIGGGFTGLNTAWQFKKDNPCARVIVLESHVVGYGASGRNGGFNMKLFGLEPEMTILRWGKQRFIESQHFMHKAVNHLKGMVEDHQLQSDYRHTGMFRVAYSEMQLKRVEKTYNLFQKNGIDSDMSWHSQDDLRSEFNTERFLGGMYESNTGILNPCKQVREVKRLALEAGVEIYEMSPVDNIDRSGKLISVRCNGGTITSEKLVIATNAYTRLLKGAEKLKGNQFPLWTYQIVTERLTDAQWQSIGWDKQQSFEDNRQLVHYFRPTVDGRITMGGGDVVTPNGNCMDRDFSPSTWQHCEQHLKWIYPQLKDVRVEYRWGGPVSVNMDMTPEIGFLGDERIIYTTGCIGHGVSLTHLNGRLIADLLNDNKTELTDFWTVNRKAIRLPGDTLTNVGAKVIRNTLRAWDWYEERGLKNS